MGTSLLPGVWKRQAERVCPFLPWPLQEQLTVAISVKRMCWSCVPLESSFPEKVRKSSTFLQSAEWSQCAKGENRCPPQEGCELTCQPSHRRDGTLVSSGAPPNCGSALHCFLPGEMCNGTSLASACLVTPNAEETMQRETRRGRDTYYIPFSCSFSIKNRNFIKKKVTCAGGTSLEKK